MKYEVFNKELNLINDINIRNNAKIILDNLPDYFYTIPAASTGKYHPLFANSLHGLVKHTKVAVFFANTLFGIYKFDNHTKDIIIVSLLIHDGLKKGFIEEKYTRFDHPLLISELLDNIKNKLTLSDLDIELIKKNVASHMGRWNRSEYSDVTLPIPTTVTEKFVHMCDYLASRKQINFEFDEFTNLIE